MLLLILNVVYVLLAIGMIALILMQRGAGAQAGASATVFGSRGSSNFMSKSTKWLGIVFFVISLFMAWYATHNAATAPKQQDLGVMAQVPAAPATKPGTTGNTVPGVPSNAPASATPASSVPAAPAAQPPAAGQASPAPQPPTQTPPGG